MGEIIGTQQLLKLQNNFEEFRNKTYQQQFMNLYREFVYYPLMIECYANMFYHRFNRRQSFHYCPNPSQCETPPVHGAQCTYFKIGYLHIELPDINLIVHIPHDAKQLKSDDGCLV